MDKVIQLLNSSILVLNQLDKTLKILNEEELEKIASSYPFNDYFHEVISKLKKWKIEIEND
ncbi:hypothetical protein [Neobacillus rhizophilus]|uniref:Uncharacterized protein n=1 Tax=Neobacillus rhizophilus TaxID=2833579 RepID=A0A942U8U4_9BACI|nr:hypothetical protein [Neobacillus rhizophilus]MBS4214703.1 hypothetical protein [Neobacillus rhizophilus]